MAGRSTAQQAPPVTSAGMDHSEEMLAEVDEPPDDLRWSPTKLRFGYMKSQHPSMNNRRESLLTRQLHSETEHTDEERPGRAMSTQSTWSNQSATSMTELTSDDGRSVPSPAISPPLPPSHHTTAIPTHVKPLEQRVKIVGEVPAPKESNSEQTIEANLGRKRCISFACKGKSDAKPVSPPTSQPAEEKAASPPKRKCMLKFVCPTKSGSQSNAMEKPPTKRAVSPPPPPRRSSSKPKHRGSDSTVTHVSPKSVRKSSVDVTSAPPPTIAEQAALATSRRYSFDSDDEDHGKEATRFHEFATSEGEPEEWIQESTCHRSRLTVDDTLKKEHIIRKTCEEAEEEVLEEDEEDDDLEDDIAERDEIDVDEAEEDESDDGFHSDDEGGFASSDDEGDDDSDFEWWRPGGASTAATSVEHLDRLAIVNSQQMEPASSVNSDNSEHMSPKSSRLNLRKISSKTNRSSAIPISSRRGSVDLPDSTDFVCGTLDEDRPIEQAYINRKKAKDAAKRPSRPQDIDPSFPTSDPEMDEEDDDDVDEVAESNSEDDDLMHGKLDIAEARGPSPPLRQVRSRTKRSSPPPAARAHSPPPPKRSMARSPAPVKRARSPAPRKLFGNSPPLRTKSPAPGKRMTSPPNSPVSDDTQTLAATHGLAAGRPQITHTASLPRTGPFALGKTTRWNINDDDDDATDTGVSTEVPKRGAIDIVKGVEFKRQRRREKLYQKMCAKYAAKGEKQHKVKPGKGAERMREVGLQLQEYKGKAEHILSL